MQEQVCQGTGGPGSRGQACGQGAQGPAGRVPRGLQAGCPGAGLRASTGPSWEAIGTGQGVTWTQNFRRRWEPLRVSHEEWP